MNNKKIYEAPELEVNTFAVESIMDGSGTQIPGNNGGIQLPDDEW